MPCSLQSLCSPYIAHVQAAMVQITVENRSSHANRRASGSASRVQISIQSNAQFDWTKLVASSVNRSRIVPEKRRSVVLLFGPYVALLELVARSLQYKKYLYSRQGAARTACPLEASMKLGTSV
jgi:hypothetical protein